MTDQTNQKPITGWIEDGEPDWGNLIVSRLDERKPFATEAGYYRMRCRRCRLFSHYSGRPAFALSRRNRRQTRAETKQTGIHAH